MGFDNANITEKNFRDLMAKLPKQVSIVGTKLPQGGYIGCTLTSFSSVASVSNFNFISFSLKRESSTLKAIFSEGNFIMHFLVKRGINAARFFSGDRSDNEVNMKFDSGGYTEIVEELNGVSAFSLVCNLHSSCLVENSVLVVGICSNINLISLEDLLIYKDRSYLL